MVKSLFVARGRRTDLDEVVIGRCLRQAQRLAQIRMLLVQFPALDEMLILEIQVRMLAVGGAARRVLIEPLDAARGEDFRAEAVDELPILPPDDGIGDVDLCAIEIAPHGFIDERRLDAGFIAGDAHNEIDVERLRGAQVAICSSVASIAIWAQPWRLVQTPAASRRHCG